jgi:hypothetical protein
VKGLGTLMNATTCQRIVFISRLMCVLLLCVDLLMLALDGFFGDLSDVIIECDEPLSAERSSVSSLFLCATYDCVNSCLLGPW